jgi:tetratricopeptide (TPR) repeat protein
MLKYLKQTLRYILLLSATAVVCQDVHAQLHPERRHVRRGNRLYEASDYAAAEREYGAGVVRNPVAYEPLFNLGGALYRQERGEEAAEVYGALLQNPTLSPEQAARAFYNLGNTHFRGQNLQAAAESYMQSLILNPDDMEAKYNLAYVLELMKNQPPQNDDEQEQDDEQEPQESDGEGDSGDSGGEQSPEGGNEDKEDDKRQGDTDKKQGGDEDKPRPAGRENSMTRNDAEQMLDAIQHEEDKTRDKANEKQTTVTGRSGKNW